MGNVFFRGSIQGLLLGGEHWGMVSLFVPRDVLFQMAMKHNSLFTWRNSLDILPTDPLKISHVQTPSLYHPHLTWEPAERGGYESKGGDKIVHPRGAPI